ncbi:hypothetical protein BIY26_21310 [Brenneria goodwinii]|uniref:Uncharacterized protein n=1 Tax=Brenneria goodwinii TaxID=1109412 RepID=A0AAE8EMS4_9GAMM|nr:microcin [Brenneria goodwinii]ATA26495.1 hypothetical protein AWC36_21635 [Brenneria goodwinii]MCG8157801.1 microcin [Brenneria goodwinii]MCG8161748.1 microcin [Brenneria goodwinii]MCG8171424.1 microcin [Brenneria goodwinii]MCG8175369.1 microcin [Brenneria goodwinii]
MRALNVYEIKMASAAGTPGIAPGNAQIIKDVAIDAGIGAAFTPGAPLIGAGLGAAGSVIHGAINHGPVCVPIPVMIGPTWNGSGGGNSVSVSAAAANALAAARDGS